MKLFINRDQDSGMLGTISFVLSARVELLPEERELIKKYKAHQMKLITKEHPIWGTVSYKIEDFIKGITTKCKDISEILERENLIKNACEQLYTFVDVMASFGGEEVIEFYSEDKSESEQSIDASDIKQTSKKSNMSTLHQREAENEDLTFCYHCGEELSDSAITCPKCGKEI